MTINYNFIWSSLNCHWRKLYLQYVRVVGGRLVFVWKQNKQKQSYILLRKFLITDVQIFYYSEFVIWSIFFFQNHWTIFFSNPSNNLFPIRHKCLYSFIISKWSPKQLIGMKKVAMEKSKRKKLIEMKFSPIGFNMSFTLVWHWWIVYSTHTLLMLISIEMNV